MRFRAKIRKMFIRWTGTVLSRLACLIPVGNPGNEKIGSILLLRFGTLGESLLVFPLVEAVRERYPGARIDVLTRAQALWRMCPGIDGTIRFTYPRAALLAARRFRTYDVVIDTEPYGEFSAALARLLGRRSIGFLTGSRKAIYGESVEFNDQQYEAQTFLDLLAPLGVAPVFSTLRPPRVDLPESVRSRIDGALGSDTILVAVNLGSSAGAAFRRWPLDRYTALLRRLSSDRACRFVFVGLNAERMLLDQIRDDIADLAKVDFTCRLTVEELAYALSRVDLLVTPDTGTMHLGAALGKPVFSIFGPNLPARFAPRNEGSVALYHPSAYSPCINVHLPPPAHECPCRGDCVRSVTVDEVHSAIDQFLRERIQPGVVIEGRGS